MKDFMSTNISQVLFFRVIVLAVGLLGMTADAGAQDAIPKAQSLGDGWFLRTGVLPENEPKASLTPEGVLTIEGGGQDMHTPRVVPPPGRPSDFTSAFVYRPFEGDFIVTGRRISGKKGTGHENGGSGVAAIGNLSGKDTGVAKGSAGLASNDPGIDEMPVWFRIVRRGDRVGVYEGPDGKQWMACQGGAVISKGTVYAGFYTSSWGDEGASRSIFDSITVEEKPAFTYSTTWLANEFEGGWGNTVNSNMIGLAVHPDGTCFTAGMYGEQEAALGRYLNGKVLTSRPPRSVGDPTVVAIIPGQQMGLVGRDNHLNRFNTHGDMSRSAQSPEIGKNEGADSLRGLAIFDNEIFVSSRPDNLIYVLDLETYAVKRKLPMTRPGPLAVDPKGVLWAIEEGWTDDHPASFPYDEPFRLFALDRTTGQQMRQIEGLGLPAGLAADDKAPSGARLLVADNGLDQQVKIFDVGGNQPRLIGTLGAKGGVFAGTPGEMKPGKFNGVTGVGTDAEGNIYTTANGYPYRVAIVHSMPNISELKAFAPSAIDKPDPEALWTLHCTAFNIMGATWDRRTGDVYVGGFARYGYDAARGLGREWRLDGLTANQRDAPDAESFWRTFAAAPDIRWLDGERFLFLSGVGGGGFRLYRLDQNGNLGALVRIVSTSPGSLRGLAEEIRKNPTGISARFPENAPAPDLNKNGDPTNWTAYEWVDGRGGKIDGRQQREEYRDISPMLGNSEADSTWIDARGGIWYCNPLKKQIFYQRFLGLKDGIPQYEDEFKTFPLPEPFISVFFAHYDPERDVMVLSGQTEENRGTWLVDAEAVRYTNWSTDPKPGERILYMPPHAGGIASGEGDWRRPHMIDKPVGWAVAGDILYATNRTGTVRAYDLIKGNLIEWMDPGPEVLGIGGYFEGTATAVRAFETDTKGEHLVLRQSNNTIRIIAHRWNPYAANNGKLPLAPEPWVRIHDGQVELLWGGRTYTSGTVKGYYVYRSETKTGPYQRLGGLIERSSMFDTVPNGKSYWYRVSTVNLVGEGPQSEPMLAAAAAPMATLLTNIGRLDASGLDTTTRGNWQGVYGADAAYLATDHLKQNPDESLRRYSKDPGLTVVSWPGIAQYSGESETVDDEDRLQSLIVPGGRVGTGGWHVPDFRFSIKDGRPRHLTIAIGDGTKSIVFREFVTGRVILEHKVARQAPASKTAYVSFVISGQIRVGVVDATAFFLDQAPPK